MKILYVAMKYDYGDPTRGSSFEHYNFYDTLAHISDHEVVYFPFDEVMREQGRDGMNVALLRTVQAERPELVFFLFTDEIAPRTIKEISEHSGAITFNWFADDHWRWFEFSRHWVPLFHWVATTDRRALGRYRRIGYQNVILSQWACNHFTYKPSSGRYEHDVTFIGQPHSNRRKLVSTLEQAGIHIRCWGYGWPNGRLMQAEMIRVFSRSRINLSFARGSEEGLKSLSRIVLRRRSDRSFQLVPPRKWVENVHEWLGKRRDQIKGRNFEIPGSGGFLLTGDVERLSEYYVAGQEVAVFSSTSELINRIRFYLANDGEREKIREAGNQRTLRDHTYVRRFNALFRAMDLDAGSTELAREAGAGGLARELPS